MPIITLSIPAIADVSWEFDRPAQTNRSAYTNRRKTMTDPWHACWYAEVTLSPKVGEASILPWRAFLAKLKGEVNSFRLRATERAQGAFTSPASVVSSGAVAANSTTMQIANLLPYVAGQTALPAGSLITVNDQLLILTEPLVTNSSSVATATFEAPLRAAVADGAPVVVDWPTALMKSVSSRLGWSVTRGQLYGGGIKLEEDY